MVILLLVAILIIIAVSPAAPYARSWGYLPSGTLAAIVVLVLLLWLTGSIRWP